jgi:hypothetical protein
MDEMKVAILSLVGIIFTAAMICLVFIFGRHGIWSFHKIPKLAKAGDRLAKTYLWLVYFAFGLGVCISLLSFF